MSDYGASSSAVTGEVLQAQNVQVRGDLSGHISTYRASFVVYDCRDDRNSSESDKSYAYRHFLIPFHSDPRLASLFTGRGITHL